MVRGNHTDWWECGEEIVITCMETVKERGVVDREAGKDGHS